MATFICNPKALLATIKKAGPFGKLGRTYMNRVHLRVRDGIAEIGLIDYHTGILTLVVPNATGEGEFTAPLRELALSLGWARGESVTIARKDGDDEAPVKLAGDEWSSALGVSQDDDQARDERKRWVVPAPSDTVPPDLRTALRSVAFAMCSDETRLNLCGVNLRFSPGELAFEAVDGHRLARVVVECEGNETRNMIIQRGAVEVLASIPDPATSWAFDAKRKEFHFIGPSWSLITQPWDDKYPDTDRVFPKEFKASMTADVNAVAALTEIKPFASKRTGMAHFAIGTSRASVKVGDVDSALVEASFLVCSSTALKLGFNVAYLTQAHDSLKAAGAKTLEWRMNDEFSPVVIRSPEVPSMLHLIMPMRV